MGALTDNRPVSDIPGQYISEFAYKEASTGSDAVIYMGSLLTYEPTTGGVRKAVNTNTSDVFAGVSIKEISVEKSTGTAGKSTIDPENVKIAIKPVVKLGTAIGATNTAKCTELTNGHRVYIATDAEVSVKGTASGTLILVGRQVKYVSDTEVWVELFGNSDIG